MSTAIHNDLNQLTSVAASAGPVKFAGHLDEGGIVYVENALATMGIQNTSFVAYPTLSSGTPQVELKAMDYATNWVTNVFQVTLTNNGVAKTLIYDLNGNLTEYATATLTNKYDWDAADRLVKISRRPAGGQWNVTQFTYDGLGRRVRLSETTNNSTTTRSFLWCDTDLCEERNSGGGTVNRRFFGQGEQISGTNYVFTQDHLGSVREMINSGGTIQARYEYDPYGRRTKVSGSSDSDFGFTGHFYHQKSELHLALYRAYDADVGRWISRDPIEETGGMNLYSYVGNKPLVGIDFDGLAPQLSSITYDGNSDSFSVTYKYGKFGADTNIKRRGSSFGISASANATFAPTMVGAHVEGTAGAGIFPGNDFFGTYTSGGSSAGPLGIYSPNNPKVKDLEFNPSFGAFAGAGLGLWVSNAQCPSDLEKTTRTVSVNLGPAVGVSLSVAFSYGNGIYHLNISGLAAGRGNIADFSVQTTTTKSR